MSDFNGKNVLVTGGAGFVGSHLVDALVERGANVTVFDNLSTGRIENVATKAKLVQGDTLDRETLQTAMGGQEHVFHFAANADVRHGLENPFPRSSAELGCDTQRARGDACLVARRR